MDRLNFEWDSQKAASNEEKHGVSFEEATTIFSDPHSITIVDPRHFEETRFVDIGISLTGRVLVVVYTEHGQNIRLISSRKANRRETSIYEQGYEQ